MPASAAGLAITPHLGLDLSRTLAEVALDSVVVGGEARLPLANPHADLERALQIALVLQ